MDEKFDDSRVGHLRREFHRRRQITLFNKGLMDPLDYLAFLSRGQTLTQDPFGTRD